MEIDEWAHGMRERMILKADEGITGYMETSVPVQKQYHVPGHGKLGCVDR